MPKVPRQAVSLQYLKKEINSEVDFLHRNEVDFLHVGMHQVQYLRNDMLDYLDFWYMHRPPSNGNNLLHMSFKDFYK